MQRLGVLLAVLALGLASGRSEAAALTIDQRRELAFFALKAMGMASSPAAVKNVPDGDELNTLVATGLNLNGHLCAELLSVAPLKLAGKYEATCTAYRGGSARKTYVIDSAAGTAFEQ
jgi:hypothetical protein